MTRTAPESSSTQRERIYNLLVCAQGDWVELPKIAACAAQYNARVFELRRLGFRIENRTKEIDGVRQSWFRLVSASSDRSLSPSGSAGVAVDLQTSSSARSTSPIHEQREETLPLFPSGDR